MVPVALKEAVNRSAYYDNTPGTRKANNMILSQAQRLAPLKIRHMCQLLDSRRELEAGDTG